MMDSSENGLELNFQRTTAPRRRGPMARVLSLKGLYYLPPFDAVMPMSHMRQKVQEHMAAGYGYPVKDYNEGLMIPMPVKVPLTLTEEEFTNFVRDKYWRLANVEFTLYTVNPGRVYTPLPVGYATPHFLKTLNAHGYKGILMIKESNIEHLTALALPRRQRQSPEPEMLIKVVTDAEVETDFDVRNLPKASCVGSRADESAIETEVKIEIDIAEDPSLYWDMTAKQHIQGSANNTVTIETASVHMNPTSTSAAGLSTTNDMIMRIKQEAADESSGSSVQLMQDAANQCTEAIDVNSNSESNLGNGSSSFGAQHKKRISVTAAKRRLGTKTVSRLCGATLAKPRHLIHTGEKLYICQQCSAMFKSLWHLRMHMKIHTGEKPYACQQCGATFTTSAVLRRHMRIHAGEKPYACQQCGAKFQQSDVLERHTLIHTGEKCFVCQRCGSSFTRSLYLKAHMPIHSREKNMPVSSVVVYS